MRKLENEVWERSAGCDGLGGPLVFGIFYLEFPDMLMGFMKPP
jgi:hypothetical protein